MCIRVHPLAFTCSPMCPRLNPTWTTPDTTNQTKKTSGCTRMHEDARKFPLFCRRTFCLHPRASARAPVHPCTSACIRKCKRLVHNADDAGNDFFGNDGTNEKTSGCTRIHADAAGRRRMHGIWGLSFFAGLRLLRCATATRTRRNKCEGSQKCKDVYSCLRRHE